MIASIQTKHCPCGHVEAYAALPLLGRILGVHGKHDGGGDECDSSLGRPPRTFSSEVTLWPGLSTGSQAFSSGGSLTVQSIFISEASTTDRPKPNTRDLSFSIKRVCGSDAAFIAAPTVTIADPAFPCTSFRAAESEPSIA